jgi:hypothetical protein
LRWPAGKIRSGDLLYDDGSHLWAYRLTGKRRLIWTHPTVQVAVLAAGSGGHELGLSIYLNPTEAASPSSLLYLMSSDGSIRVADAVDRFGSIGSVVFLRDIPEAEGAIHLYWVRWGSDISKSTGRLDNRAMVDDAGRSFPVSFALRLGQAPSQIAGYPGGVGFTVAIYSHVDVPAQYEVLKNAGTTDVSSPVRWGEFSSRGFTDSNLDVAWVSPNEYVVPVSHDAQRRSLTMRVFHADCRHPGGAVEGAGRIGYRGSDFDSTTVDGQWYGPLLPAGPDRVLAVTRADFRLAAAHKGPSFWSTVDLKTGRVFHVPVPWKEGAWAMVSPPRPVNRSAAFC